MQVPTAKSMTCLGFWMVGGCRLAGWQVGQARLEVARISRRVVNRGVALITSLVRSGAISNHNNDDGRVYQDMTASGVPQGFSQ
jgi:hypothetical protein